MEVAIKLGDARLKARLLNTNLARSIYACLPHKAQAIKWGDEIFFDIPVFQQMDNPTLKVSVGDMAYWPSGRAFCIFYGPTPASRSDEPVPASEVEIFGRVDIGIEMLKKEKEGLVTVERI